MRWFALLCLLAGCGDVRLSVGCRLAVGDTEAVALVALYVPAKGEVSGICSRVDVAELDEGEDE